MCRRSLLAFLFSASALAQSAPDGLSSQTFHFLHADTAQARQEIVNAMQSIGEIRAVTADPAAGTLLVRGTTPQLDLAQWIFGQLDQAPGAAADSGGQYQLQADHAPYVRTFFLAHTAAPPAVQQLINAIRATVGMPRVVAYTPNLALMVRGNYDEVQLAAWLVRHLDVPPGLQQDPADLAYDYSSPRDPAVRIFRLAHATAPLAMQELINAIRSISEVQRATVCTPTASLILRGAPEQMAVAAWLVQELDRQPTSAGAIEEYPGMPFAGQVVKVASLPPAGTPRDLQALVNTIRVTAGIPRIVFNSASHAVVFRAGAGQAALAEQLIRQAAP
jgi:hypothetical protein